MVPNKKLRTRYIPKPAVLPAGMRADLAFEMPGFQASEAMGRGHFQEQHVYDLLSNADMARRIAPDGHAILPVAQALVEAIAEIQVRAQRTGNFGVNSDEMRVLREGVGKTMAYLRGVSNVAIARAGLSAVREFNRIGVLRV